MYIVGAGPGDPDLLTVKARKLLEKADVVVYAGSLINPEILKIIPQKAEIYDSSKMNLSEIIDILERGVRDEKVVLRLHSGDPHIYGALKEQTAILSDKGIEYEVIPAVSVLTAAAASLDIELTMDNISQAIIIARGSLRIPVPQNETIEKLASHGSTMVIFTGIHIIDNIVNQLIKGGFPRETPVGVVYHSTWKDEIVIKGTLGDISSKVKEKRIYRTAIIVVGKVVSPEHVYRTKLYSEDYIHSFRRGTS
ncbi:MAG: precorrin-4 C(11)-methyltransferase [Thermoplasmatales archaeon]